MPIKLSIIIPAHNEERTIAEVLQRVFEVELNGWEKEVIVVDDGSTDSTGGIVDRWEPSGNAKEGSHQGRIVIRHPLNLGKGAAIQTGLKRASGDYVLIQDADLEYDPKDIPQLLSLVNRGASVAVFGNRGTKSYPERGFHYVVGAKLLSWTFNVLFFQRIKDLYTGYKLIPLNITKNMNIESAGFEFEAEVACKLAKRGVKIKEVRINYRPRNKEQGKHIGLVDAFSGFWMIIKQRF